MNETTVRALLVEDEPSYQQIVSLRLRHWRPELALALAISLGEARELLDRAVPQFDLIIIDQHLPDGYGWTLLDHPRIGNAAVLAVSADDTPTLPAQTLRAGAQHFLHKRQISEPLFIPLIDALVERRRLEQEVLNARMTRSRLETIQILLSTLRHEINNPLGAVLGGAYLIRQKGELSESQQQALKLIESSGQRIKHVIEQLCHTAELETVIKAHETVFQIPGDKPWEAYDTPDKDRT